MDEPLAMFPLGSVLLPGMPLALNVFEARFLAMLAEVTAGPVPELGVVLIDRGHETGGGDTRFGIGTVARLVQVQPGDSAVGVVAFGGRRIRVRQWLADDPYPRALVEELPDLEWDERDRVRLEDAAAVIDDARRRLDLDTGSAPLPDDPLAAAWRLAAIAPVGPLDRLALLEAGSVADLLDVTTARTSDVLQLHEAFGSS